MRPVHFVCFIALTLGLAAHAQTTFQWNGATSTAWNTASNWTIVSGPDPAPPTSTSTVRFAASTANDPTIGGTNRTVGAMQFLSGTDAETIGGTATLTLAGVAGTGLTNSSGTTTTFTAGVAIGSAQTWTTSGAGSNLTLNRTLNLAGFALTLNPDSSTTVALSTGAGDVVSSSVSGGSIVKNGAGTLTFGSVANTFNGGITLNAGTTTIAHNASLGAGTVTFGGGTLAASGAARNITNPVAATGTIVVGGSLNFTFSGATFALGAGNRTLQIDNTATTTISGALSNNYYATTTKTGNGTLVLSGNNASFAGPMVVSAGTLQLEHSNALGTSTSGNSIADGATLALNSAGSLSITEGSFTLRGTGADGNGALRNLAGTNTLSATLNLAGATTIRSDAGSLTVGILAPAGFALVIDGAGAFAATGALNSGGNLTLLGSGNRSFGAAVNLGANTLSVQSTGTHTFTGATTANAGIAVATGTNTFSSTVTTANALALSGGSSTSVAGVVQAGSLQISDTAAATFTGNVTASSGIALTSTGAIAFNGAQVSAASSTFTVDTTADLTLATKVVAGTFTQAGSGNTTLGGSTANQLANVAVNAGTLILAKTGGADAINASLTIGDGAGIDTVRLEGANQINNNVVVTLLSSGVLDLNGYSDTVNALALTGGSITTGAGTLTLTTGNITTSPSATPATIGGNLAIGAYSSTFNVADGAAAEDLAISANISGANKRIVKTGAGTLVLSGTNTFADSGGAADAGLNLQGGTTLVTADVNLGNSANNIAFTGGATLQVDGTFTAGAGRQFNFGGAGTIDVTSGNTLTISGLLDQSGAFTKAGTGTIVLNGASTAFSGATTVTAGTLVARHNSALGTTAAGTTVNSGATLELQNNITVGAESLALNGTLLNTSGNNAYQGAISGTGSVDVTGGDLTLSGTSANSYTGPTSVTGGTLALAKTAGVTALAGAISIGSGGTLRLDASNQISDTSAVTLAAGATPTFNVNGRAETIGSLASANPAASVALGSGGAVLTIGAANTSTSFAGVISGIGTLAKTGTGTLTLANANTFTGAVNVNAGTLLAGAANILTAANTVTLATGATLDLATYGATVASIAGAGTINLGSGAQLSLGSTGASSTFSGALTGTGVLEKTGAGTLTFDASINFAGELKLTGGTLALGGINLTVGTLRITGNTILDFGASTASVLSATNLIIENGAILTINNWVDLQDYFYASGSIVGINGGTTYAPTNVRGAPPLDQISFTGFAANTTIWQGGFGQVTPTPEPATYGALMVGAALGLLGFRRYRRRSVTGTKT